MSQENVEKVRAAIDAMNRGEFAGALEVHPDVEWQTPPPVFATYGRLQRARRGANPLASQARAESERESWVATGDGTLGQNAPGRAVTIRMEQAGDLLTVHVIGELGLSTAKTFEAQLRLAISGDASTVVLDLGDVHFIDSTGLRSVVRIANQSLRAGARLRMRRTSPSVQKALKGGGLEHLLPSVD